MLQQTSLPKPSSTAFPSDGPSSQRPAVPLAELLSPAAHGPRPVRFLCVVGTRPEVIKMAPLIHRLRASNWAQPIVVASGQQNDLLDNMLADFGLSIDIRLAHDGGASRTPAGFLSHCLHQLEDVLDRVRPDVVIAQGDTTTVHASAMAAFYRQLPFVHIEAGLRTGDMHAPFPEEYHRRAIALATTLHCAPTEAAADNLRAEGIRPDQILMSGNTVIDALLETAASRPALPPDFPAQRRTILLTLHRRENFGANIRNALTAVRKFVNFMEDVAVYFPVHPNPNARDVAHEVLDGHPRIHLVEPLGYRQMVAALQASWCVLTDSGGLQEEAPALGKPVLVLRDSTERPEAVASGVAQLVGTSQMRILQTLVALDCEAGKYEQMARVALPYGDGHASERIVSALQEKFGALAAHQAAANDTA